MKMWVVHTCTWCLVFAFVAASQLRTSSFDFIPNHAHAHAHAADRIVNASMSKYHILPEVPASSITNHNLKPLTGPFWPGVGTIVFKYIGYLVVRPSKFLAATIPGPGTYLHITKFELSRSRSGARVMIEFLPLPVYDVPLVLPTLLIARVQNVYSRYSG
jgi:hypothetical protein